MQIKEYLFQSPYQSQVQVGRLDPSSVKDEQKTDTKVVDFSQQDRQNKIKQEQNSISVKNSLDIYA